ncbi:MAG: preprotein translocase subunit SecG [Cardiobacteriaceae bacterium]|nr:preprotein translocase subunit SecG [Cardiobacteriaceae bacterium]
MILSIAQVIFVGTSIALIVLVLLQQSKGAGIGASFGAGASATVFGARGAGSFLYKLTRFLALVFFVSALAIGYVMNKEATSGNILAGEKGGEVSVTANKTAEKPVAEIPDSNSQAVAEIPENAIKTNTSAVDDGAVSEKVGEKLDNKANPRDNAAPANEAEIPAE